MNRYLKVVGVEENIFNEKLSVLYLKGGSRVVSAIKTEEGLFVEGNSDNEKTLHTSGYGFLSGNLEVIGDNLKFYVNQPHTFIQLHIGDMGGVDIDTSVISDEINTLFRDLKKNVNLLADMVSEALSDQYTKILAVPEFLPNKGNTYTFKIYQKKPGFMRGVHLVHNRHGISRIMLRKNYTEGKAMLVVEAMHSMAKLNK